MKLSQAQSGLELANVRKKVLKILNSETDSLNQNIEI